MMMSGTEPAGRRRPLAAYISGGRSGLSTPGNALGTWRCNHREVLASLRPRPSRDGLRMARPRTLLVWTYWRIFGTMQRAYSAPSGGWAEMTGSTKRLLEGAAGDGRSTVKASSHSCTDAMTSSGDASVTSTVRLPNPYTYLLPSQVGTMM